MEKYSLVGVDGNAYSIMAYVWNAMEHCGFTKEERKEYQKKAMSSDYDNLLYVSFEMIDKCNDIQENK